MVYAVLADIAASVSEFKKDPVAVVRECSGEVVLVIDRNVPAFYAVPPARYQAMLEQIESLLIAEATGPTLRQ